MLPAAKLRLQAAILAITAALLVMVPAIAGADPNPKSWENWKTDFSKSNIPLSEVVSGGPPKDGIPAIDDPKFVAAGEAELDDREPVIVFTHNEETKAYPLSVLMWHEIANDRVGGHPFAVTYCPLCNAAIVFDAQLDGKRYDFGTTGRLRNSDLLMYDRQTESWWQQFSGKAVIGALTGRKLKMMPSRLEAFGRFRERHGDAKVLVPNNPSLRDYGRNPYVAYDGRDAPYPLYTGTLPQDINPMARVVIVRQEGEAALAVTLDKVRKEGTLKRGSFVLEWQPGRASALDSSRIAEGRDVGNLIVQQTDGGNRRDAVHDITFAFVAHAFHPDLKIEQ